VTGDLPALAATAQMLRRLAGGVRVHGSAWLAEARARPLHLGLAGVVLGLLAGPGAPLALLAACLLALAVAGRASVGLCLVAALLGGGLVATARLEALDRTALPPGFGHALSTRVTLLEAPRARAFGARAAVVELGGERVLLRAGRRVRWPAVAVGGDLAVQGVLSALAERDAWLRPRNVHAELRAETVRATGSRRGGAAGTLDAIRGRAERGLSDGLPPAEAALLRGMALGQDEALPSDLREAFRAAGLSHLVAASGQNVMLLAALVLAAAAAAGAGLRVRFLLVLAAIAIYVPLAGGGPSIQRAGVMGAAGVVAVLAGRPAARWYALLLAAAITLAINPRAAQEPGWQLSFAAVAAILLLASRATGAMSDRGLPAGLAQAIALTAAATIGTAPLIALHFDRTSLVSLPANVLAAPAVAPVMWLGMTAAAVSQVAPALGQAIAALAGYPLAYLAWLAGAAADVPLAEIQAPAGLVALVCGSVTLAIAASHRLARHGGRRASWRRLVLAAVALAAVVAAGGLLRPGGTVVPAPSGARVTFLDVGQGDATLVQERGTSVLVDTGPPDGPVLERLRRAGVRRLDALVVTHAQDDHDGAAAAVLRAIPVDVVLDGRDGVRQAWGTQMAAEADRRRVRRVAPAAGQVLRAGRVRLRVLSPPRRAGELAIPGEDPNQRAIVAEADVDGLRVLLTADAESDVLAGLDLAPVDVLKVSHHGSADPGLEALLPRLHPRIAAIEVGRNNTYGHPVPATIATLRTAGAVVYRTDRDGSVRIEPDGTGLRVQTHA
jgi:competence protein ComEC